jgi:Domain of unknown function (DUF5060)/Domain of unknown function (DUF5605)/Protein of unknown function (DUF4038)
MNPTVLRVLAAVALGIAGLASPAAAGVPPPPKSVEQWGVFELALRGPTDGNPFTDVRLAADFTDGFKTVAVTGFYDGDGIYRIRFMPDRVGEWRYETQSNRWPLTKHAGTFTVTPPPPGDHGPVRVFNTYHFAYADGTPYWEIGTTCYNWTDAPDAWEEQTLKTLAASPFNKVRMLVFPQNVGFEGKDPPLLFPYEGTPPDHWDFTRFNPAFFRHLEMRIGQLRDLGIEADVILFNPYGKKWGFDSMNAAGDDRYLRYLVARLAAYRNVWWSMANEYDFLRTKTEADWDRFFQIVQQSDPYGHLRSIHNGALIYNNTRPWVTHASIQNGSAVEDAGRAELYRDVYRKPVVFDEVKYEGDSEYRWGHLTGQEMVLRFWMGTVAGCYVGHGDYFTSPEDRWVSYGGVLRGQSPPRLAFLKKILETAPAAGIDPIDKWQDPAAMGGQPGEYYLLYFGKETPASWPFRLYKANLTDGMKFHVDVLDTWNMTITPVPGEFVTKKENAYDYTDEHGRAVPLPGKPYLALRIRRVADTAGKAASEPPTE